jgi:hypothetical protein
MSLDQQTTANGCADTMSSPEAPAAPVNGAATAQTAERKPEDPAAAAAADDAADGPDRAQQVVDRMAHHVGYFAAFGTRKVVTFLARTREALQDFWAEVQDYRHGRKP